MSALEFSPPRIHCRVFISSPAPPLAAFIFRLLLRPTHTPYPGSASLDSPTFFCLVVYAHRPTRPHGQSKTRPPSVFTVGLHHHHTLIDLTRIFLHFFFKKSRARSLTCPSSSSLGVSTPYLGGRSPAKLLVCDKARFTPDMCDIGVTLDLMSFFLDCELDWEPLVDAPPADDPADLPDCRLSSCWFSSTRNDGISNSCCLSVTGTEELQIPRLIIRRAY